MAPPEPKPQPPPQTGKRLLQEEQQAAGGKRRALPACLQRGPPPPQARPSLQQHQHQQQPRRQQQQQQSQLPWMRFQGALTYVSADAQAQGFDHEDLLLSILARAEAAAVQADAPAQAEAVDKPTVAIDLEWTLSFTAEQQGPGPTALLQLAVPATSIDPSSTSRSGDIVVFLFQLAHLSTLPPTLRALLCHAGVRKVGVNVRGDMHKLGRDRAEEWGDGGSGGGWPTAFVELSDLANHAFAVLSSSSSSSSFSSSFTNAAIKPSVLAPARWSLDRLAQAFLGQQVAKPSGVRLGGDWARRPLSHEQMEYAATDAYATLGCFLAIAARILSHGPLPAPEMSYSPPPVSAAAATTSAVPTPAEAAPPAAALRLPSPPSSALPPLALSKRDAHAQFVYGGQSLQDMAAGYPYDWPRVRAAIVTGGGGDGAAVKEGKEPAWMGRARAVHAELLHGLETEQGAQQQEQQQEQQQQQPRPGFASSNASAAAGLPKMGRVWWALKEEYGDGGGLTVEFWQVALLVAHLNREAAAAAMVKDG